MIDRVVPTPNSSERSLDIVPHGALPKILAVCSEANMTKPPGVLEGCQLSVVAGARNLLDLLLNANGTWVSSVNFRAGG